MSATCYADSYDYEVGLTYDASRASSESGFTGPIQLIEPIRFESDSDDDEIGFAGTWFFDGVAASNGPRSRAAFIGRASAVSLSYTRGNGDTVSTVTTNNPATTPFVDGSERSTNNISANLRWVWPESGWYGLAGLARSDFEADSEFVTTEVDAHAYSLGFGKYIGAQTTLELTVVRLDSEASGAIIGGNSTSTETALAFSHIGSLGRTWSGTRDVFVTPRSAAGKLG